MVEHQQSVYKWQSTFLAANQDAFRECGTRRDQIKQIVTFKSNCWLQGFMKDDAIRKGFLKFGRAGLCDLRAMQFKHANALHLFEFGDGCVRHGYSAQIQSPQ
jgi:hypothetical protein